MGVEVSRRYLRPPMWCCSAARRGGTPRPGRSGAGRGAAVLGPHQARPDKRDRRGTRGLGRHREGIEESCGGRWRTGSSVTAFALGDLEPGSQQRAPRHALLRASARWRGRRCTSPRPATRCWSHITCVRRRPRSMSCSGWGRGRRCWGRCLRFCCGEVTWGACEPRG